LGNDELRFDMEMTTKVEGELGFYLSMMS